MKKPVRLSLKRASTGARFSGIFWASRPRPQAEHQIGASRYSRETRHPSTETRDLALVMLQKQLLHAAQPAVVLRGLDPHVVEHFGVRQDEEGLGLHDLHHLIHQL